MTGKHWGMAVAFGLGLGLAGAGIFAGIAIATDYILALLLALPGALAGLGVAIGFKKGGGQPSQAVPILGAALAVVSIIAAYQFMFAGLGPIFSRFYAFDKVDVIGILIGLYAGFAVPKKMLKPAVSPAAPQPPAA